ncbi:MAG: alpha/beta hydrolase [Solirubrobacterales bacterium]
MEYSPPQPPSESGRLNGIAWCVWLPPGEGPFPAVIVLHGAGSRKENHADYARAAVAQGLAALTFDNRGHGESEGPLGDGAVDDIGFLAASLAARPEIDSARIGVRGSSMGGLLAIHAAAQSADIAAAVAICPAAEWMLAEDVQRVLDGRPPPAGSALSEMQIDAPALAGWLDRNDVEDAAEQMGAKPLLLIHARGDEVVPYTHSEKLYERAAEPKRLLLLDGGHHRSAQHDPELQGESLRWLARAMK